MKIAYVVEKFPSPTEYFVLNEITELEKQGIDITILVLRKQKSFIKKPILKDIKAEIFYLPIFFFYFPFIVVFNYPFSFFQFSSLSNIPWGISFPKYLRNYCISLFFKQKLNRRGVNHIHAHFAFISVDIANALSKLLGVKFSLTAHAQDIYTNVEKIKQVVNDVSFLITCTKYNSIYLNKLTNSNFENKIFPIYHGINLSKWKSDKTDKKFNIPVIQILSIARLVEKKGLIYLLKAICILLDQGHKVKCTIIGEGPLYMQLEKYIQESLISHAIDILDFMPQENIRKYFIEADVFILPSIVAMNGDRDGLPNVILEAMAMNVPVISTSISGISEVIEDRITGLCVIEKDEKALAKAILEIKNNPELYNKIIKNSKRKVIEEFAIEKSTDKIIEVFRKLLIV